MSIPVTYSSKSPVLGQPLYNPLKNNNAPVRVQNIPLNQNFQSYKVLREQMIDKVQEFVLALDNPHSSLNQFVKMLRNRYGFAQANKIIKSMDKLSENTDKILNNHKNDNDDFFDTIQDLIKNIGGLQAEIVPYLSISDAIDELNPEEANYSLIRFMNDFNMLNKAEKGFPKSFRSSYINDMLKNNS